MILDLLIDKYRTETNWLQKCIILHTIHLGMVTEFPKWRVRDSALLLKIGIGTASEDLKLAENIDVVKDCSSRNNALKKIKV
jgi:hypothetical protein